MTKTNNVWLSVSFVALCGVACGGNSTKSGNELFQPKPACMGDPIVPYQGSHPQVLSALSIGTVQDGFDLNGDGTPDNKLAAVGSLAMDSITKTFAAYQLVIPLEYFNFPTPGPTSCVKFALYYGDVDPDRDGDGSRPGIAGGDCNDNDPNSHPGATEIPNDGLDNNCNGVADEGSNQTDGSADDDGDGQTIAEGDCDDHDKTVYKGAPEICNDGKDNDCDGVADRSVDGSGNVIACSPYMSDAQITLDPLSFGSDGTTPLIAFDDGVVDGSNTLTAGPSVFAVNIPLSSSITLPLKITGAQIKATMNPDGSITNGRLGGVIDARTADQIRGLDVSQIGLTPQDSLLDAVFANVLGPLLALPKASTEIQKMYPNCRTPDIDVDGDGLEAFCDSLAGGSDDMMTVDTCIDGDGTVVHDEVAPDGTVTKQCTEATLPDGTPRFVDGISVELNFTTVPITKILPPAAQ